MKKNVSGLHHITAIADNAQRNYDFYTKVLGLRLVKQTVNFDDPGTYHFYYGNETGTPGTILTFFPWEGIGKGRAGNGQATEISYSVPAGSFDFWKERFRESAVETAAVEERFGNLHLPFRDSDGLHLSLVIPRDADPRAPYTTSEIPAEAAIRGFEGTTLSLAAPGPTADVLTEVLDYVAEDEEKNRFRFRAEAASTAAVIDLLIDPEAATGHNAAGTNHHIAFRVADEAAQMEVRERLLQYGLQPTPVIDRDYFFSIYFREPGGVLFEIATDNPGFLRDETLAELGSSLQLPDQYEAHRDAIEQSLPDLQLQPG